MNLTDKEIAADFDRLNLLQGIAQNALGYLNDPNLQLSPERRQELIDLDRELSVPLSTVFCRAKLIASPYYEHVALEQLPYQEPLGLGDREGAMEISLTDKELSLVKTMQNDLSAFSYMGIRNGWLNDIQKRELGGVQSEDVVWLDQEGKSLGEHLKEPPVDEMTEGRPIIARMPNNTKRVFVPERRNGILAMQTYSLRAYLDKQTPGALKDLYKGLDKVDPWFVKSSKEFKAVQSTMEKLQKEWRAMGPNPTEYQRDRLREQMEELDTACYAYIEAKNKKGELNDRDKERLAAVKNVRKFANPQLFGVEILTEKAKKRENVLEGAAVRLANSEEAREERHQGETVDQVSDQYRDMQIPSSSAGDELEKHTNLTGMSLRSAVVLANNEKWSKGRLCDQITCYEALADMVITDLCLKERMSNGLQKEGDAAGPFETLLNKKNIEKDGRTVNGVDLLREQVMATPTFKELAETLDIKGTRDFIAGRRVQSLSRKVIGEMTKLQKSAEKAPAKETVKQKTVEAAPKKPTLG